VLTVGPIERFEKSKQLVSYLGLNPRESSSGGKQRLGSISKVCPEKAEVFNGS
jgi:transposase